MTETKADKHLPVPLSVYKGIPFGRADTASAPDSPVAGRAGDVKK